MADRLDRPWQHCVLIAVLPASCPDTPLFTHSYVEHKLELDAIKETADKMQSALDDTHRALHAEAARRMGLEEVVTVAKMEAARSKELVATLAAER